MTRLLTWLTLLALPAAAHAQLFAIGPANSHIDFTYKQMGAAMNGSFRQFSGSADLDPKQPQKSAVSISVQTGSISLGSSDADQAAAGAEFFDIKDFPQARFQSRQVQALGNGHYRITGTFTVKNVARPLTVDALMQSEGTARLLTGNFALKRLDYDVGTGAWADTSTLGNEVKVSFSLRLLPAPAAASRR